MNSVKSLLIVSNKELIKCWLNHKLKVLIWSIKEEKELIRLIIKVEWLI